MLMAVTSFFNSSLEPASVTVHLFCTSHSVLGVFVAHSIHSHASMPWILFACFARFGKGRTFPRKKYNCWPQLPFFCLGRSSCTRYIAQNMCRNTDSKPSANWRQFAVRYIYFIHEWRQSAVIQDSIVVNSTSLPHLLNHHSDLLGNWMSDLE